MPLARVPKLKLCRGSEAACVEPQLDRLGMIDLAASDVCPVAAAGIQLRSGNSDEQRRTTPDAGDPVYLPTSKNKVSGCRYSCQKFPVFAKGKLIQIARREQVRHIERFAAVSAG